MFPWDQLHPSTDPSSHGVSWPTRRPWHDRWFVWHWLRRHQLVPPRCWLSNLAPWFPTIRRGLGGVRFGWVGSPGKGWGKKNTLQKWTGNKTRYNMCIPFEKNIALVGKDCRCSDLLTLDETGKLQRDCHEVKKYPTQPAKWTRMRRKRHPPFIHPQIWSTFSVVGIPLFDQTMHRWTPKCCATLSLNLVMGGSFYREDGHQWANIWIWCDICIFLYMQYKMYM